MNATPRQCPSCGASLAADVPEGLCPKCLLQRALEGSQPPPLKNQTLNISDLAVISESSTSAGSSVRYFGDYELLQEIARGGMGVVWKARQTKLNRIVAVKMILSGRLAGDAEVKRFRTEAEAAAQLQHPNIVAIHEVGEHDGQNYFSMDFVEGQSLAEMIFHRPLPPELAAKYVQAIAGAIHYAHQKGVLHRDLKPSNVLIDHAGQTRVTDFGLAKLMESDSGVTHSGAVMGSPSYMPPEQAAGRTREMGPASDVYSLGAILYELITGRPPFRAATPLDTMKMVVESEPAAPQWVNPNVPSDLETICLKCLEKDPRKRYHSAKELADELDRFLKHEPILARPVSALQRAGKWTKRKPAHAALVAAGVLAVALFALAALFHTHRLNDRLHQMLLEQARAERLLGQRDRSLQHLAEAARMKPSSDLRNEAIQTLAQPGVRLERRVPYGKEASFTLSADGSLLMAAGVVHSYSGRTQVSAPKVRVYETATGKLLNEIAWDSMGALPVFSPDARVVALPQDDAIVIWEPRTGKELGRVKGDGALMFSPDSQWLAIAETNGVKVARWANLKEEKRRATGAFLTFTRDGHALVRDAERIVKWNFREGGESFLTPGGLGVIAVNAHGAVAALWERSKPGAASAPRPAEDNSDAPGSIIVFDLAAQKRLAVLPTMHSTPTAVRFSADGRLLAFLDTTGLEYAAGQQAVRIYDVEAGRYRQSLTGISPKPGPFKHWRAWWSTNTWNLDFNAASPAAVSGGEFIGDGSLFAAVTGLNELFVTVWSTETGEPVATLPKSAEFAASGDGRWLVSKGEGSFMHYANGDTYAINMDDSILAQTAGVPTGARELPRGPGSLGGAVSGTDGLVLQLWSVASGVPTMQMGTEIHTLAFSRDGQMLTAGGRWNNTEPSRLLNVSSRQGKLALHPVNDLAIRTRVYFAGADQIWEAGEQAGANPAEFKALVRQLALERREFPVHIGIYNGAPVFSPDGRHMLVASYGYGTSNSFTVMTNQAMLLWDLPTMSLVKTHAVTSSDWSPGVSAFSPDGKRVATSAFVHQGLDVLDAATLTRRWHAEHEPLTKGRIFRLRVGELFGKGKGYIYDEYLVTQIAFTPDGRRIVSLSANHLTIRDADTGAELGIGRGHEGYIQSLAVSRDGKYAVTGGLDRTIRVWEIPTGREIARWEAHDSAVTSLAFSPDGATLASGSNQGALKLWNLQNIRRELKALGLDWR